MKCSIRRKTVFQYNGTTTIRDIVRGSGRVWDEVWNGIGMRRYGHGRRIWSTIFRVDVILLIVVEFVVVGGQAG